MQTEAIGTEELAIEDLGAEMLFESDDDFESFDDESFEDESYDDEGSESYEDESLLNMFIPPVASAVAGSAVRGVTSLFAPKSRQKRVYRGYSRITPGKGVGSASIATPRGQAQLRLPSEVVPMATYRRDIAALQSRDNSLNQRINQTQGDLAKTEAKATQALAATVNNARALAQQQVKQRQALTKLHLAQSRFRKQQQSQNTMNMLLGMMQMQNVEQSLRSHRHDSSGTVTNTAASNPMMMMLPLMMAGDSSSSGSASGGDNSMMMLMMVMMMGQQGSK
ncbi:MAG: hypothetical protein II007_07845 [Gammaproteobacteria bacterium]|nr:hypothetical protein [Gammaproteobacteria bacterium]